MSHQLSVTYANKLRSINFMSTSPLARLLPLPEAVILVVACVCVYNYGVYVPAKLSKYVVVHSVVL